MPATSSATTSTYVIRKCIDDIAYIAAADAQALALKEEAAVWLAIQLALMAAQRYVSDKISGMQEELAKRRMAMGEEALAHAKKTWAKEKAFVDEVMAVPKFEPNYVHAQATLIEVDRVEGLALLATDDKLARLGLQVSACEDSRTRRLIANVRTDLTSHAMRAAEGRAVALNDQRFSRQLSAAALGRGVLMDARSMGALGAGHEIVSDSLINTINSGLYLWGYSANRWQHGGNFATGVNGPPIVVPQGYSMVEGTGLHSGTKTLSVQTNAMAALLEQDSRAANGTDVSFNSPAWTAPDFGLDSSFASNSRKGF